MNLFFDPNLNLDSNEVFIDKSEIKHIEKVLRKKKGDFLNFTNGKGLEAVVEICGTNKNDICFKVKDLIHHTIKDQKYHIALSPLKKPNFFEMVVSKATELGIKEITPIICKNSLKKSVNYNRCNKIIISSLKQSLQYHLPKINKVTSFKDFVLIYKNSMIAHCNEGEKTTIPKALKKVKNKAIIIGPEGDFSLDEINFARENNYNEVTLGSNRLRSETAAIVACSLMVACE
jgi:16S rRNA (uracil1498-N3)-methyltransferase